MPVDANGVPSDMSHVYATGNIAADMLANAMAESSGRVLASRLYNMAEDAGMTDMLSVLIARDTMHRLPWLAVIEELGGIEACMLVPNSTPEVHENLAHSYSFPNTSLDERRRTACGRTAARRWTDAAPTAPAIAPSPKARPHLASAREGSGAQKEPTLPRRPARCSRTAP